MVVTECRDNITFPGKKSRFSQYTSVFPGNFSSLLLGRMLMDVSGISQRMHCFTPVVPAPANSVTAAVMWPMHVQERNTDHLLLSNLKIERRVVSLGRRSAPFQSFFGPPFHTYAL